jgi:hypothetical protein
MFFQIFYCWSASCSMGDLCCWQDLSKPHTGVLVSISVDLETGYSNWNLSWFLKYCGKILLWFLLWLQLLSPWYRSCEYLDTYCAVCVSVLVESKDVSYRCEKSMLSYPLMAMIAFFLHSFDSNMHNHSITQLCITYQVNKHLITKNQCKLEYVYTFLYNVINIISTQFVTYFFSWWCVVKYFSSLYAVHFGAR